MPLNPRQQCFVEEYLVDLNATQAAARAGYKHAKQQGHRLLTNDDVKAAIDAAKIKRAEATGITAERVLNELAKIGFANMADYVDTSLGKPSIDFSKLTDDQMAAVSQIETDTVDIGDGPTILKAKFKLHDKQRALELLGKHLNIFTEKVEVKLTADTVAAIVGRRKEQARERRRSK